MKTLRSGAVMLACACIFPSLCTTLASPASAAAAPSRQAVVDEAMKYLHYKYSYQGDTPKTGFSCIGFVSYVFRTLGIDMPGGLTEAIASYAKIRERELLPGDIVFFRNTLWKGVSHVAIYIGDGKVIHAENPNRGVNISAIRNDKVEGSYWQQHYLVAERPLVGDAAPPATKPHNRHVTHASVTAPSLNLRADHSLSAIVVTVLERGTKLIVLGHWNGWLKVQFSPGITGWVLEAGVHVDGSSPSTSGGGRTHRSQTRYPILAGVNIHSSPALKAEVVSVTTPRMTVAVLGHKNGFDKIRTPQNVSGWTLSRFVEAGSSANPSKSGGAATGQRHASVGTLTITAHLRTGPSLNNTIVEWVPAGTRVKILGRGRLWDHVRVNAKLSGYIYSEYVKG
jgi:uncharacterized protein YgiM (DUF1202 family)